ncbi:choice-of-anchor B family protein [Halocola ammonii]
MNRILLFSAILLTATASAQTPCENGMANGYPCSNVDLYSILTTEEMGGEFETNDIWGWTDPETGNEYAVVGLSDGTAFVDITDPLNPLFLGSLATHTDPSLWRDVKVYQNHAFIVSEANMHGMQVFDLTQLRDVEDAPVEFEETTHYELFGNAHNLVINEETGYAYAVGTSTFQGGLHIVDISEPTNPQLAGSFAEDGYTHDAQAIIYNGPDADYQNREIVFACNENTLTIVDVDDKEDCQLVAREEYEGNAYSHQGWVTEDHRYFLLDDEIDENQFGHNTKTYIWDIEDLDNPVLVGAHLGVTEATDHNMYIQGDFVFQSNYNSGLRILELTDLASAELTEVGFFDVVPNTDESGYEGSWSNYPYFESGIIALTGMQTGLFLVKPTEGTLVSVNEKESKEFQVGVYPNPASDFLNVRFSNFNQPTVDYSIVDITGKQVASQTNFPAMSGKFQLNISDLSPGIYMINFGGQKTKRFVVK